MTVLYGVSYYHEYQPYERLERDVALMVEMNVTVVRLGESTWANWEPEDGRFETAWMDRVVDALHGAGIRLIFGTPTYAIPPWLFRKHPEIMAQRASGVPVPYGRRQNVNLAHPTYLRFAERIIRTLVAHYAPHPGVIGFQIDNETRHGDLHNPDVFQRFLAYLEERYESVENLNERWGLTYWSHRINDWDELWRPDGNSTPGYHLEWRRFQASLVTEFLAWQAAIVREVARPDQFVMQDFVRAYSKPEANVREIARHLDVVGVNAYHVTQAGLELDRAAHERTVGAEFMGGVSPDEPDVHALFLNGDWGRSAKQAGFMVPELNANSVGESHINYPGYPGQLRLAAYTLVSKGARLIAYWHWHTLHYGWETYWGGVLGHSLEKGRIAREFERIATELKAHGAELSGLTPDADVAFLYHEDSKYALGFTPALALPGRPHHPDRESYARIFSAFHRFFSDLSAQTAVVHPDQAFERTPLLVVPALYAADDPLLERLRAYVEGGGHLLLTFRSAYADAFARARWERAPGPLRDAVGASYDEYSNLATPVPVASDALELPDGAAATAWIDGLEAESAEVVVRYRHPFFGRFAAVTSHAYGKGRLTYCGTLPDAALGGAVARYAMDRAGLAPPVAELPDTVRVVSARAESGRRLLFFTNWSWNARELPVLAGGGRDLLGDTELSDGARLPIGPWDVKIVVQENG